MRKVYDLRDKRVWVAGHRGMVGSALVRRLGRENCRLLTAARSEVDLRRQAETESWMRTARPEVVFVAAATVGGIAANASRPADFLYDNLLIEANIIRAAFETGVEKLIFLGSSCIYPKFAAQPISEEALLTGPLEPTNEAYAVAKIAGIKLALAYRVQYGCDFIAAMPCNLYGPGDTFDLANGHVLPALIRRAHDAKASDLEALTVWGSGSPRREFLHVDDCADALVHLAKTYSGDSHINIGSGEDVAIHDLVRLVAEVVGFRGDIVQDLSKPDGTPRKLMSVSRLSALGWSPTIGLENGVAAVYGWFLANVVGEPARTSPAQPLRLASLAAI